MSDTKIFSDINKIYCQLNTIYDKEDFYPKLNEYLSNFLIDDTKSLSEITAVLLGTNTHKKELSIKSIRDKIHYRAIHLANLYCINKGVPIEDIQKEVDFLLKNLK